MRRIAVVLVLLLAACSSDDDESSTSTTEPRSGTTTTSAVAADREEALATSEPCTRTIQGGALPAATPFWLDDLERMVLTRADVGGLRGFEADISRHGYQGNGELQGIEVNPKTTCDDLERFGRLTGFGTAYETYERATRRVLFSVHLFWTDADARGWSDAFVSGLRQGVGDTDGPTRVDVTPSEALGPGSVRIEHEGSEGIRSWIVFVRGPVVGWVIDLHTGNRTTIDVEAAATAMAARVEQVSSEASGRVRSGLDAAALLSAPLPLDAWGPRYDDLEWDPFFGGCADDEERAAVAGEDEAEDARRFGRLAGCTSMFAPAEDAQHDVVRIFSAVEAYRDEAGATADFADGIGEHEANGGQRFEAGSLGDEAVGVVIPPNKDAGFTQTRVVMRIGTIRATVVLHEKTGRDAKADMIELAEALHARVTKLLAAS